MAITLSEDERELLLTEVAQAMEQVRRPEMRVTYGELLTAVDQGEVPEALLDPLQTVLEVGLESGRIRRVHTAHGEMAANRVYSRTPRGRTLREAADAVNTALQALEGQAVQELKVASHGPGQHAVTITTEEGTFLLRFDHQGARLQSVEVG